MASLGQTLKEEREARNISIEEIAAATKIVPRYLEALEADRLDIMPGGFFIRGIIRTYARFLGLDGDDVQEGKEVLDIARVNAVHFRINDIFRPFIWR